VIPIVCDPKYEDVLNHPENYTDIDEDSEIRMTKLQSLLRGKNRMQGGEIRRCDDDFNTNAAELLKTIRNCLREKEEKLARRGSCDKAGPLSRSFTDIEVEENWGIEPTIKYLKDNSSLVNNESASCDLKKRYSRTFKHLKALLHDNEGVPVDSKCELAIKQDTAQMLLDNLLVPDFMEDAADCVKTLCMPGGTHGGGIREFRTGELPSVLFRTDTCLVQWPATVV